MLKKQGILLSLVGFALMPFIAGCAQIVSSGIISSNSTIPATIETLRPGFPIYKKNYKVLGQAEGKATATNVLGLFAFGNGGINMAYERALQQYPEADMLTDVHVDQKYNSFLVFFYSQTTIVKGKAVQLLERKKRSKKRVKKAAKQETMPDTKSAKKNAPKNTVSDEW